MATTYISDRTVQAPPRRNRLNSLGADALAIVIGLSFVHTFRFGSVLPMPEVFLVILSPFLFVMRSRKVLAGRAGRILLLLGLWLIWQIATDVYRQTAFVDWIRGDALIIFFAIDFVALAALLGYNERRKALFIASLGIGIILNARFEPTDMTSADPWKFGYSLGVEFLVIVVSCYFFKRRNYVIVGLLFTALVLANLAFYFRSPILSLMITMALILPVVPERIGHLHLLPRRGTNRRIVIVVVLATIAAGTASYLVGHLAAAGVLGENAQKKNAEQSKNKLGILIGGRPEILVSSRAVMDSPILGHGSWAKDPKYRDMLSDLEVKYGMEVDEDAVDEGHSEGLIPGHSHLMEAWVNSGIFGAVFWMYIFVLTAKSAIRASTVQTTLAPIYIFLLIGFAWDILFSPFGASQRLFGAIALVIIRDLMNPPVRTSVGAGRVQFRRRLERTYRGFPGTIQSR